MYKRQLLEQDVELEEQPGEMKREDALRVAAKAFHAIYLDGEQLEVARQGEPVGIGSAGKVHLGPAVRLLLVRSVLDLLGKLDVGESHRALVHIVVEGSFADRELGSKGQPDGLDALSLRKEPLHLAHHVLQLGSQAMPA